MKACEAGRYWWGSGPAWVDSQAPFTALPLDAGAGGNRFVSLFVFCVTARIIFCPHSRQLAAVGDYVGDGKGRVCLWACCLHQDFFLRLSGLNIVASCFCTTCYWTNACLMFSVQESHATVEQPESCAQGLPSPSFCNCAFV